jgi:hypothetical protein
MNLLPRWCFTKRMSGEKSLSRRRGARRAVDRVCVACGFVTGRYRKGIQVRLTASVAGVTAFCKICNIFSVFRAVTVDDETTPHRQPKMCLWCEGILLGR